MDSVLTSLYIYIEYDYLIATSTLSTTYKTIVIKRLGKMSTFYRFGYPEHAQCYLFMVDLNIIF